MLATGLAVLLIAVVLVRAALDRNEVSRRRAVLIAGNWNGCPRPRRMLWAQDGRYATYLAPGGGLDTARFVPPPASQSRSNCWGRRLGGRW